MLSHHHGSVLCARAVEFPAHLAAKAPYICAALASVLFVSDAREAIVASAYHSGRTSCTRAVANVLHSDSFPETARKLPAGVFRNTILKESKQP